MTILKNSRGFTLLETMIAMTIMLLAFASILMVQSSSMNTSAKAKQMNVVGMLAKNALLKTEVEMTGKKFSELQEETSETFEEPFQDYTWVRTVKEITFPNLSGLLNAGKQEDKSTDEQAGAAQMMDQMTKLMTNYISKAIREVTITIKWKRGSGEQQYVVAMYWVDLNSEFQLMP